MPFFRSKDKHDFCLHYLCACVKVIVCFLITEGMIFSIFKFVARNNFSFFNFLNFLLFFSLFLNKICVNFCSKIYRIYYFWKVSFCINFNDTNFFIINQYTSSVIEAITIFAATKNGYNFAVIMCHEARLGNFMCTDDV